MKVHKFSLLSLHPQYLADLSTLRKLATEYEVLQLIGSGSFGWVYRCRNGQDYACKIIEINADQGDLPEFEINFTTLPSHINIVRRYEWWQEKTEPHCFLVVRMEHCEQSLEQAIRHGFFRGPNNAIKKELMQSVMRGALSGLIFIHENRLIHRDIKSANILITHDGIAKIADFGIATRDSVSRTLTLGVGTPVYTAPEVYQGNYGSKVDVFSFGVVLFEVYKLSFAKKEEARSKFPDSFGAGFNVKEISVIQTAIVLALAFDSEERPSALEVYHILFEDDSEDSQSGNGQRNTVVSRTEDPTTSVVTAPPSVAVDTLPVGPGHWPPLVTNPLPVIRATWSNPLPEASQAQLPVGPADLRFHPMSLTRPLRPTPASHFSGAIKVVPTAPVLMDK